MANTQELEGRVLDKTDWELSFLCFLPLLPSPSSLLGTATRDAYSLRGGTWPAIDHLGERQWTNLQRQP